MWKEYSKAYLKNNRSTGVSIMIGAFISALLLSLLCGLFYNAWKYEVERIRAEEGGWHSRLTGELDGGDLELIRSFSNVEKAVINEEASQGGKTAIELYFFNMAGTVRDTEHIAALAGLSPEAAEYHHSLLAMYLVRDTKDTAPRLVFPVFILITLLASVSLAVMVHNLFAVSMNDRIHQFGIFSSIGATPGQIRTCLLQEAASLCAVPVIAGNVLGTVGCMAILKLVDVLLGSSVPGRRETAFGYHPLAAAGTLGVTVLTIWISARIPAGKLSRMTPLEAIRNTGEAELKKRKRSPVLAVLFKTEGELAGNALKAQKKALRTASVSLSLSFLAFTLMLCFFTLSDISTQETFFERYQDVWDVMATVEDTRIADFEKTDEIRALPDAGHAIVYQKVSAERLLTEGELSDEMTAAGGFSRASDGQARQSRDGWLVDAPVMVLDDESFLEYCVLAGVKPGLDGAVVYNRVRDMRNPDFRHPDYLPYLKEKSGTVRLYSPEEGDAAAELPVLGYASKTPSLREGYGTYELVHFVPASLWKKAGGSLADGKGELTVCVLGKDRASAEALDRLQTELDSVLEAGGMKAKSENRFRKTEINEKQIQGMKTIFGGFCVLLSVIGIGNVFSYTLGFVRQRKRELARYLSVGMTPDEIRKMFCIEALVIAGRPVLITVPSAAAAVWLMLRASYVEAELFWAEAPVVPAAAFMAAIACAVAFAYFLGWRSVRRLDLAQVLRDDTMI